MYDLHGKKIKRSTIKESERKLSGTDNDLYNNYPSYPTTKTKLRVSHVRISSRNDSVVIRNPDPNQPQARYFFMYLDFHSKMASLYYALMNISSVSPLAKQKQLTLAKTKRKLHVFFLELIVTSSN